MNVFFLFGQFHWLPIMIIIWNRYQNLQVRVGTNKFDSGGTFYTVQTIILHENDQLSEYDNDIAILKVNGPIKLGDHVQTIPLSDDIVSSGSPEKLYSPVWENEACGTNDLELKAVTFVSEPRCQTVYGPNIMQKNFCGLYKNGLGSCQVSYAPFFFTNWWMIFKNLFFRIDTGWPGRSGHCKRQTGRSCKLESKWSLCCWPSRCVYSSIKLCGLGQHKYIVNIFLIPLTIIDINELVNASK